MDSIEMDNTCKIKRANDNDQKLQRRQSILDSAKSLFTINNGKLPTVSLIAKSSGLAKGTVYLYFSTKEEIFLALIKEEFEHFFVATKKIFIDMQESDKPILLIASATKDYLLANPDFLHLASLSNSIIEQNIEPEMAFEYKRDIQLQLISIGSIVDNLYKLDVGTGAKLLWRLFALLIGLWQLCNPPKELKELYDNPDIKELAPNFGDEIIPSIVSFFEGTLIYYG